MMESKHSLKSKNSFKNYGRILFTFIFCATSYAAVISQHGDFILNKSSCSAPAATCVQVEVLEADGWHSLGYIDAVAGNYQLQIQDGLVDEEGFLRLTALNTDGAIRKILLPLQKSSGQLQMPAVRDLTAVSTMVAQEKEMVINRHVVLQDPYFLGLVYYDGGATFADVCASDDPINLTALSLMAAGGTCSHYGLSSIDDFVSNNPRSSYQYNFLSGIKNYIGSINRGQQAYLLEAWPPQFASTLGPLGLGLDPDSFEN